MKSTRSGRQRGAGLGGGHDEREQTLNQLLVEMDGFSTNEGIIVMASTNRPDILDPALLRPGRFDRHILIDRPDVKGREAILKVHIKGKPLADNVNLEILAKRTPGFTGADLANMVNEAALLTARRDKSLIGMEEMEESIERVIAGPEKKTRVISEKEKRLVAYHEAGHAIVAYHLPHTDKLHKISIIPRGRAGGYTLLLPEEDRNYITRSYMLDEVTTLLGGRVAEAMVLKDISTGAQNDLERASSDPAQDDHRIRHERGTGAPNLWAQERRGIPGPGYQPGPQLFRCHRLCHRQGSQPVHGELLQKSRRHSGRPVWTASIR